MIDSRIVGISLLSFFIVSCGGSTSSDTDIISNTSSVEGNVASSTASSVGPSVSLPLGSSFGGGGQGQSSQDSLSEALLADEPASAGSVSVVSAAEQAAARAAAESASAVSAAEQAAARAAAEESTSAEDIAALIAIEPDFVLQPVFPVSPTVPVDPLDPLDPLGPSDLSPIAPSLSDEPEVEESNFFFFSYDDTSSTAARDLTINAIENGRSPDPDLARPFEFLNAEEFSVDQTEVLGPFNVSMGLKRVENSTEASGTEILYSLGVSVSGPELDALERPNIVLTLLVDVSGSMNSLYAPVIPTDIESLLDVTKHGLLTLRDSLRSGDVINLVSFNNSASVLLEEGDFDSSRYSREVDRLRAEGGTNLNAGIELAYEVARRQYDPEKSNRVILMTDAFANSGEVEASVIARNTTINSLEGIHFAGVGIGSSFNDAFLNELTDIGRGVYSAMITPEDAERIFTTGFIRFIDHAVSDVRFKLEFPESATHAVTAAEQISTVASDVQTINFSFNDSQYFLEIFSAAGLLEEEEGASFALEVSYENELGESVVERVERPVTELLGRDADAIASALMVTTLTNLTSGQVECADVLSSGLYSAGITANTYVEYRALIDSFCGFQSITTVAF